jgi:hypothetical protein
MANPPAYSMIAIKRDTEDRSRGFAVTPCSTMHKFCVGYTATIGEPESPPVLPFETGHIHIKHEPRCVSAEIKNGQFHVYHKVFILFRAKNEIKHAYDMLRPTRENYSSVLIPSVNSSVTPLLGDVIIALKEFPHDTKKNLTDSVSHLCITFPRADASQYLQYLAKVSVGMQKWLHFLSCLTFPLTDESTFIESAYQNYQTKCLKLPDHNRLLEIERGCFTTFNPTKRVADGDLEDSQATQRPKV